MIDDTELHDSESVTNETETDTTVEDDFPTGMLANKTRIRL